MELEKGRFVPIQSLDLEAERQITFDLYLHMPINQRLLLYRRKGGALESDRLLNFVEGNFQNFMIRREDYNEFVKYVAARLKGLIDHPDPKARQQTMMTVARSILSSTFQAQDSSTVNALMGNLNEITGVVIESALDNVAQGRGKSFQKLVKVAEQGSDFHKHPVNCTSLAVLITYGIGYSTYKVLSDVAIGALLHDIGLAKLPSRISAAAHEPLSLSRDERRELYRHGEYGLKILEEKKIPVTEVIRAMVAQHHEQFNGFGYPAGLRGFAVNEFAQILRVADELDHLIRQEHLGAESLRSKVMQLFSRLQNDKLIEPDLASRIRRLFL